MQVFVHWYNHEHCHSAIRFVTPQQRHSGQDKAILQARTAVYEQAKREHPQRWRGREVRDWQPIGPPSSTLFPPISAPCRPSFPYLTST